MRCVGPLVFGILCGQLVMDRGAILILKLLLNSLFFTGVALANQLDQPCPQKAVFRELGARSPYSTFYDVRDQLLESKIIADGVKIEINDNWLDSGHFTTGAAFEDALQLAASTSAAPLYELLIANLAHSINQHFPELGRIWLHNVLNRRHSQSNYQAVALSALPSIADLIEHIPENIDIEAWHELVDQHLLEKISNDLTIFSNLITRNSDWEFYLHETLMARPFEHQSSLVGSYRTYSMEVEHAPRANKFNFRNTEKKTIGKHTIIAHRKIFRSAGTFALPIYLGDIAPLFARESLPFQWTVTDDGEFTGGLLILPEGLAKKLISDIDVFLQAIAPYTR